MLPPSYFTPWGPGALYAELYLGLCRALAAPWLSPAWLDHAPAAPPCAPAQCRSPSELAAAEPSDAEPSATEPAAAATEATPESHSAGAAIIPFDRARARLSRRRPT
jgi:hypothetical protein